VNREGCVGNQNPSSDKKKLGKKGGRTGGRSVHGKWSKEREEDPTSRDSEVVPPAICGETALENRYKAKIVRELAVFHGMDCGGGCWEGGGIWG